MRLLDLEPMWKTTSRDQMDIKIGVIFRCPCGQCSDVEEGVGGWIHIPFSNPIGDGRPRHGWERTGESFEDLTLKQSIWADFYGSHPSKCRWHGFITAGEVGSV